MSEHKIRLNVNGEPVEGRVPARRMLSDFLRHDLGLKGTKRGCETGTCGACSVMLDGEVVKSCLSLAVQAEGHHVVTVEGLGQADNLHPLQQCFMECGGLQCGYCTPGFLMASLDLLQRNPNPTVGEVQHALGGNLCRCTGYTQIVEAVLLAAEKMNGN